MSPAPSLASRDERRERVLELVPFLELQRMAALLEHHVLAVRQQRVRGPTVTRTRRLSNAVLRARAWEPRLWEALRSTCRRPHRRRPDPRGRPTRHGRSGTSRLRGAWYR